MNANDIILWIALAGTVLPLAQLARFRPAGALAWVLPLVLVLAVTGATYLYRPGDAGYAGGAAWALVVGIPMWGSRWLRRLVGHQQYVRAGWLARLLYLVHPFADLRGNITFLRALELAQRNDLEAATALLERLAASGPAALRRTVTFQLYRLRGDWQGCARWVEAEVTERDLAGDAGLFVNHLRALGETGQLDRLLADLERRLPSLAGPGLAMFRGLGYLFAFAFGGRPDATARVLRAHLGHEGPMTRAYWLATAALTAGDEAGRDQLVELSRDADPMMRMAAAGRLARPPARASELLSPAGAETLRRLEETLPLEERYADRVRQSGRPVSTWVLAGLNAVMFGVEILAGGSEDPATLYRLGAAVSQGFALGQSWRLVASTFLHWGPLHLGMNLLGLFALGPWLDRALGARRYLTVYLGSGILAALVVVLSPRPTLLVGASGSIMGIIGGTVAVLLRGWRRERSREASRRLRLLGFMLALQVAFDLGTPEVSMTAHLAGLAAGLLLALPLRHWASGGGASRGATA